MSNSASFAPQDSSPSTEVAVNVQYQSVLPRFLELRHAELETIGEALSERNFTDLKRFGHNLHGTGAAYGLEIVSQLGTQMEEAAQNQDLEALSQSYLALAEFLKDVRISYHNTVLFVDDQPEILTLLRRLFADDEYICYFASSADEALKILDSTPVDVMVCDLVMPEMGGLELLSLVRQRFPQVVRLVLSGQAQVPSILAAIQAGQVFRYLTKPWRVDADARAVIAEAVAHANTTNGQQSRSVHVPVEKLIQLLDAFGRSYVLVGLDKRAEATSPDLNDEWKGRQITANDMLGVGQHFELDSNYSVWLSFNEDKS